MSYPTTLRRVILPQAARTAVPPLSNTLISLVKDTSLASTILVTELLRVAQLAAAPTFDFFALYGVAAIYYWVICVILSFVQGRLETRLGRYVARDDATLCSTADRAGRPQGVRRQRGAARHLVRRAGGHGHRGDRAVGLGQDDGAADAERAGPGRRRRHHDRRPVRRLRRPRRTAPPWRASARRAGWSSRATTCSRT